MKIIEIENAWFRLRGSSCRSFITGHVTLCGSWLCHSWKRLDALPHFGNKKTAKCHFRGPLFYIFQDWVRRCVAKVFAAKPAYLRVACNALAIVNESGARPRSGRLGKSKSCQEASRILAPQQNPNVRALNDLACFNPYSHLISFFMSFIIGIATVK